MHRNFSKGRRSDLEKIDKLSNQLDELASARIFWAERLKQEIADMDVRLDMAEKGLVITFVADILLIRVRLNCVRRPFYLREGGSSLEGQLE